MTENERRDFDSAYINELVNNLERTSGGHAKTSDPQLVAYVRAGRFKQFWYYDLLLNRVWYPLNDLGKKLGNVAVNKFYKPTLDFIALAQYQFMRYVRSHPK
jgi:hypothetical protein